MLKATQFQHKSCMTLLCSNLRLLLSSRVFSGNKGSFNNYVDKMRGEGGLKMSGFVHTQGINTAHDGGGGQKMAKFCHCSC